MIYKTYNCNSFLVHTIKTDKFKTAHIEIMFRKKAIKEELVLYSVLADMMSETLKNYPKKKDLIIKFEELYKMYAYTTTVKLGKVLSFNIIGDFINPKYINDKNYLENVLKMVLEMVQKPNVVNREFDNNSFKIVKERIKKEIESIKENPVKLSIRKALESLNTESSYELLGSLDDLEMVTPSKLYEAYKKLMKDFTCDIFIIGNLDMDEVVNIIKSNFKNRYINDRTFELEVINKEVKKENIISIDSTNTQTSLVMLFNVSNLEDNEKDIVMHVFNYIYGSGGLTSRLYRSIREENSLCYSISSMYLKYDGLLLVQVSLDDSNVKKAISLIKKELKGIQKGDIKEEEVEDAINNMIVSLDLAGDNNIAVLNNYVFHIFANLPLLDERKELFKKVTKEDIINVSKKIKINTICTLNGKRG